MRRRARCACMRRWYAGARANSKGWVSGAAGCGWEHGWGGDTGRRGGRASVHRSTDLSPRCEWPILFTQARKSYILSESDCLAN